MQYSLGRSYAIPTTSHLAFNSVKKSAKSKNTVGGGMVYSRFADFFYIYVARGRLKKFLPAIVPTPGRTQ